NVGAKHSVGPIRIQEMTALRMLHPGMARNHFFGRNGPGLWGWAKHLEEDPVFPLTGDLPDASPLHTRLKWLESMTHRAVPANAKWPISDAKVDRGVRFSDTIKVRIYSTQQILYLHNGR